MKQALAPVAALLIGVSILLTGQGLQGTLIPMRASLEGFSTISIGAMGAAYFFGFTLGCIKGGELVGRVGHVRVFAAMTALASASPLLHGLIVNDWTWSLLRMLTGFCFAILYVVIESWLNEQATNENRGTIFATYVMITLSVLAAGQMMVLLYDPVQMQLFAIASVLVSLAAIPVALSTSATPALPQQVSVDLPKLVRISPAGTLGCLLTGLANGAFWALAPVFTAAVSGNPSLAAWFMTSAVVGGAILQWPIGYLSDRIGRRETILLTTLIGAVTGVVIVVFAEGAGFIGINLLGAAWGAVAFPLYALSVAHANDYADPSDYVTVSSGLLLTYGVGAIIGPFIASAVMSMTSPLNLYLFTAASHLLYILFVVYRVTRRRSVPDEHHSDFGHAMAAAHTASRVYEEEVQQQSEQAA